jgi:hypothetical protein
MCCGVTTFQSGSSGHFSSVVIRDGASLPVPSPHLPLRPLVGKRRDNLGDSTANDIIVLRASPPGFYFGSRPEAAAVDLSARLSAQLDRFPILPQADSFSVHPMDHFF